MMKQCKDCVFYDELLDLNERWNDAMRRPDYIVECETVEDEEDKHFCPQYGDGIPKHIIEDKVECKYKTQK